MSHGNPHADPITGEDTRIKSVAPRRAPLSLGKEYVPRTAAGRAAMNSSAPAPAQPRLPFKNDDEFGLGKPERQNDHHADKLAHKRAEDFDRDEHGAPKGKHRKKHRPQGGGFDPRRAKKYGKSYLKSLV